MSTSCISFDSYIKPQLPSGDYPSIDGCISFDSYIKPQRVARLFKSTIVVYLLIPTSNHNWAREEYNLTPVVYLLIPTSNHNYSQLWKYFDSLYIFWFLHQTTTSLAPVPSDSSCISFDSYIKPQLLNQKTLLTSVVYLLIPTSNHNPRA